MTKMGFLRDFQGVIGRFLREFVAIAGFIIFFDYEVAEKSLGYLCTERDFWGVYRGMLGDSRTQKPRAGVAVYEYEHSSSSSIIVNTYGYERSIIVTEYEYIIKRTEYK